MENITHPYLFKIISKEEFEKFEKDERDSSGVDSSLTDEIIAALERAKCIICELEDCTNDSKGRKKNKFRTRRMLGKKVKTYCYVQILCGWTFKPTVTYKVNCNSFPEQLQRAAETSEKMCAIGLMVSMLWNTSISEPRLFGYSIPSVPEKLVDEIEKYFGSLNESSVMINLFNNNDSVNLEELALFGNFIKDIEGRSGMCHYLGVFGRNLNKSWNDVLTPQVVELKDGTKKITFVSCNHTGCLAVRDIRTHMYGNWCPPARVSTMAK